MMNFNKLLTAQKYFHLIVLIIISACSGHKISEDEFNSKIWKQDKKGCNGKRLEIKEEFDAVKEQLIGLSEKETRSLLGAPDKVQLFERSQKFYIYYVESGAQCSDDGNKEGKEGKSYHIRFNSINQVNEVSLVLPSY